MANGLSGTIRLRYSGLVAFSSRIFSVITGLVFTIIVTRNLSVADFGIWQYLSLILGYVIFPASLLPFWITRFYARGYPVGRTGIVGNLIIASLFFVVFLLISIPASKVIKTDTTYFYIISTQIFVMYLLLSLKGQAQGRYPHLVGYSEMLFESTKIVLALLLFYVLQLGLLGAIVVVIFAYGAECMFYLVLFRSEIKVSMDWGLSKRWFSHLWVPFPSAALGFVSGLDLLLLALIIGQPEPLALYKAASTIAIPASYAASVAIALYPKLLSGGGIRDVEDILKLCFMLSTPMAVGIFTLADPLLHILRSEYEVAVPLLRLMAVWAPINSFITILGTVIIGSEKVDVDGDVSFKKMAKSRLIRWPLLGYGRATISLFLVYVFVTLALIYFPQEPDLYTAMGCFLANFIADILLCGFAYSMSRKALQFRFPIKNLGRYVIASLIMALVIWIINPIRSYETILTVIIGGCVYFAALSLIDAESRKLFRETWKYLQSFRKQ